MEVLSSGVLVPALLLSLPEEASAERFTMTVTMAVALPLEMVMEVEPVPTAVTTPEGLTVAMLLLPDLKVKDWDALAGVALAVMVRVAPGLSTM